MNVEIAQIASLVIHANAFLQGHEVNVDLDHGLAQLCQSIEFIEIPPGGSLDDHSIMASNPNDWFALLDSQGADRLNLNYGEMNLAGFSDRIGAAFSGGGSRWLIEAVNDEICDLWEGIWKGAQMRGSRYWKVYYCLLARKQPLISESISLTRAQTRLRNALDDIISFAQGRESTRCWVQNFEAAKQTLDGEDNLPETDYLPNNFLPTEAEELFVACYNSWVFGGMGSWNDYWFDKDVMDEYNQVSDELYKAICQSLVAAVNSA